MKIFKHKGTLLFILIIGLSILLFLSSVPIKRKMIKNLEGVCIIHGEIQDVTLSLVGEYYDYLLETADKYDFFKGHIQISNIQHPNEYDEVWLNFSKLPDTKMKTAAFQYFDKTQNEFTAIGQMIMDNQMSKIYIELEDREYFFAKYLTDFQQEIDSWKTRTQ